jgi:hypothetical protein
MNIDKQFEDRDSFLHWFIIAALTGVTITDNMKSDKETNITMQLNGVEINPINSINRLEDQFDRMVKDKSIELIRDMQFEMQEELYTAFVGIVNKLNRGEVL